MKDFALDRRSYSLTRYNIVVCIKDAKILITKCVNIDFTLLFLNKVNFSTDTDILFTDCFGHKLICLTCENKELTVGERLGISYRRIPKEIMEYHNSKDMMIKSAKISRRKNGNSILTRLEICPK
jgi:hypothetical protein